MFQTDVLLLLLIRGGVGSVDLILILELRRKPSSFDTSAGSW